jgi:hypothetical protein
MGAIDFDITVGHNKQQSRALEMAREAGNQLERAAISVLQIFEDEQQRRSRRHVVHEVQYRSEEAPAVLLGVARGRHLKLEQVVDTRNQSRDVGGARAEPSTQCLSIAIPRKGFERLDEWLIREAHRSLFVAMADERDPRP